jgi:hypothetical protein
MVPGEVLEQDRRLLDERRGSLGAPNDANGACSADSASAMRGSLATPACSVSSR